MAPHNDPSSLPVEDQLSLIREDIDDIKLDVGTIKYKQRNHDTQLRLVRSDIKSLKSDFKSFDKKIERWKNQLFNKIDKFMGRIKKQDEEIAAIAFRKEDHETRIAKLENPTWMDTLTPKQAYAAMFFFLTAFYSRTKSSDVGGLLGDMSFTYDDFSADPAAWNDWLKAIKQSQTKTDSELSDLLRLKLNK